MGDHQDRHIDDRNCVCGTELPGCIGDPEGGGTNIVCFEHSDPSLLLNHLQQNGVLAGTVAPGTVRLVTHCDVDDAGIERAIAALRSSV